MAKYAIIDNTTSIVTNVIVADKTFADAYKAANPGILIVATTTATKGFTYDKTAKEFIPPKPSSSCTFNTTTKVWDPPAKPTQAPTTGKEWTFEASSDSWKEVQIIR